MCMVQTHVAHVITHTHTKFILITLSYNSILDFQMCLLTCRLPPISRSTFGWLPYKHSTSGPPRRPPEVSHLIGASCLSATQRLGGTEVGCKVDLWRLFNSIQFNNHLFNNGNTWQCLSPLSLLLAPLALLSATCLSAWMVLAPSS